MINIKKITTNNSQKIQTYLKVLFFVSMLGSTLLYIPFGGYFATFVLVASALGYAFLESKSIVASIQKKPTIIPRPEREEEPALTQEQIDRMGYSQTGEKITRGGRDRVLFKQSVVDDQRDSVGVDSMETISIERNKQTRAITVYNINKRKRIDYTRFEL